MNIKRFEELTNLNAAPGYEDNVRKYMKSEISKYTENIVQDKLGSIFGVIEGNKPGPTIMIAGHMDEVGFMITDIDEQGFLSFITLGGWWNQTMLAKKFRVVKKDGTVQKAVIASLAPHVLSESDRAKPMEIKNMYLDCGATSKEEAINMGINIGDFVVPDTNFEMISKNRFVSKAIDNRYGCALALEVLEYFKDKDFAGKIVAGATVQEEVGLRGAQTASNLFDLDYFIAVDSSPANDVKDKNGNGQLGKGPLLRMYDPGMIMPKEMFDLFIDTAKENDIEYQNYTSMGGTDAVKVHTSNIGVKSMVLGIASRNIHTGNGLADINDIISANKLLMKIIKKTNRG